jgi:wyosine [tRNA(Phe)-imidazoG37] synthetase (radical SAM superfamily)
VLFTYDPKLESKHIRKIQHIEKIKRIQEREESQLRSSIAAESGGTWYQMEEPHDPDYYQEIEQALERMSQEYGE